jgi:hypothetical protein
MKPMLPVAPSTTYELTERVLKDVSVTVMPVE